MQLVIGLGNPGPEYQDTRHNIGFQVVDKLAHELGPKTVNWQLDSKHQALVAPLSSVILVKPQTFMNASGTAVASLVRYYKLKPADILLIHDDLDLPLGKIRIRQKGGSAGHNGVQSIIDALGSDAFTRVRLGIGRGKEAAPGKLAEKTRRHQTVINFVLSRFHRGEAGEFRKLVIHGADAVRSILTEGIDITMNKFH